MRESAEILRDKLGARLVEHEVLGSHTSMKVGGVADYYFEAKSVDDLKLGVDAAVEADVPYFVLGAGSNVIVSDYGYPGLVIANKTENLLFLMDRAQAIADSGVFVAHLVTKAAARELGGLEFLIGVPGTVGGALYGNASCWGGVFGDYVRNVTMLMPPERKGGKGEVVSLDVDKLKLGYHDSWLKEMAKTEPGRKPVILTVLVQLVHLRGSEIMRRIKLTQGIRMEKQPVGELSSGCIFKNPSGAPSDGKDDEQVKSISAGYLIDAAGGKRMRVGGARVSRKHANFVVNTGKATAKDIKGLIDEIKDLILNKQGIALEEEVEFLGRWDEGGEES